MKRNPALVLKPICFILMLQILIYPVQFVLQEKQMGDNAFARIKYFFNADPSPDMVLIGNSQFYCGINPLVFYNDHGFVSYNLSSTSISFSTCEFYLQKVLKLYNPKVIVIEPYCLTHLQNSGQVGEADTRRWLDPVPLSLDKIVFIQEMFEQVKKYNVDVQFDSLFSYIFPVLRYHGRWKELTSNDYSVDPRRNYYHGAIHYHGYGTSYVASPVDYEQYNLPVDFNEDLLKEEKETFERIVHLCSQNNVKLLLAKIPTPIWRQNYHDLIEEWAEEFDLLFVDLNEYLEEMGFDLERDFLNIGHLNAFGAEKVSHFLGGYIAEHYNLPDRRDDSMYSKWDDDYQVYQQDKASWLLSHETDWTSYLEKLKNPNYTVYLAAQDSLGGDKHPELTSQLKSLGLTLGLDDAARTGYLAVIDGGRVIFEHLEDAQLAWSGKLNGIEAKLASESLNLGDFASIKLNSVEYAKNRRGINIVVYDNLLEDVVDSVTFDLWDGGKAYR